MSKIAVTHAKTSIAAMKCTLEYENGDRECVICPPDGTGHRQSPLPTTSPVLFLFHVLGTERYNNSLYSHS